MSEILSQRGRCRSRAPVTRTQVALEQLSQRIEELQLRQDHARVLATPSKEAISGSINPISYDVGQDLALSKEGHTEMTLRKIITLLPEGADEALELFLAYFYTTELRAQEFL